MNYGKQILAATIATLIVGCSSESEPAPENQRPVITLTDGGSFNVNEGAKIDVPFTVTDETAVTLDVTSSGEMKGDVSISDGVLSYTAPWVPGDSDVVETITLTAKDSEGLTSSATITFTIADGNTSASVVINPPSEAFGFEKTRTDTLLNFWVFEGQSGVVLRYDITDEDADEIALDYDVESDNYLFRNNIEPALNSAGTEASLTFDLPATNNPYENATVELTVDDGDDVRRVYAHMTVINQPKLHWNSPNLTLSESSGGSLPFAMDETVDQDGTYSVTLTTPDGEPIDFDLPYQINEAAQTIEFYSSDGFLGDRSVVVTLDYTMLIPNNAGEIYEHVTTIAHTVTVKDDRDDDFMALEDRLQKVRDAYMQMTDRNDDVMVFRALNDRLQVEGVIDGNQRAELDEVLALSLAEEKDLNDDLFIAIDEAIDDDAPSDEIEELLVEIESTVPRFGGLARKEYLEAFNALQTYGPTPLRAPDSTSPAELESMWVSHYFGNSRYGSFEGDDIESFQFFPRYAYMNVTHLSQSSCTTNS